MSNKCISIILNNSSDTRAVHCIHASLQDPKEEKLVVRQGSVPPREELHTVDQDGHQGKGSRVRQAGHEEGETVDITLRPWQQQQQQQHPGPNNNTLQQGAQQSHLHLAQGHEAGGSGRQAGGGVQGQAQHAGQQPGVTDPTIAADRPDVDDQGRPVIRCVNMPCHACLACKKNDLMQSVVVCKSPGFYWHGGIGES